MLEVLVHLEVDSIPPPFQLMRIQVSDGLLHSAWPNSACSDLSSETAEWGDAWLAKGDTALARVPSATAPPASPRRRSRVPARRRAGLRRAAPRARRHAP